MDNEARETELKRLAVELCLEILDVTRTVWFIFSQAEASYWLLWDLLATCSAPPQMGTLLLLTSMSRCYQRRIHSEGGKVRQSTWTHVCCRCQHVHAAVLVTSPVLKLEIEVLTYACMSSLFRGPFTLWQDQPEGKMQSRQDVLAPPCQCFFAKNTAAPGVNS